MELLLSNIPPLKLSETRSSIDCFEHSFLNSDSYRLSTGYISSDSVADLKNIFEVNNKHYLELIIGMHAFDGMTHSQYNATKYLNDFLTENKVGEVKLVTVFPYHGKAYTFLTNNIPIAAIVGSSNLNSVFNLNAPYELDFLINESISVTKIDSFIKSLSQKACTPFNQWQPKYITLNKSLLDGITGVKKILKQNIPKENSNISFDIPLKSSDALKSNLNAFHGKGREDQKGGIRPRSWYEVELIVPKSITDNDEYPKPNHLDKERVITVITDDEWMFQCKVNGDNCKNFRSAGDLKILGRWIKGRLENKDVLKVGDLITEEVLLRYGRDTIKLSATEDRNIWKLNFGVNNE